MSDIERIKMNEGNHQAISDLYEMRGKLIHTNYQKIIEVLNDRKYSAENIIKYYNRFIKAVFELMTDGNIRRF